MFYQTWGLYEEESKMCQLNFALLRDDDVAMFYRQFDWFFGPRS